MRPFLSTYLSYTAHPWVYFELLVNHSKDEECAMAASTATVVLLFDLICYFHYNMCCEHHGQLLVIIVQSKSYTVTSHSYTVKWHLWSDCHCFAGIIFHPDWTIRLDNQIAFPRPVNPLPPQEVVLESVCLRHTHSQPAPNASWGESSSEVHGSCYGWE